MARGLSKRDTWNHRPEHSAIRALHRWTGSASTDCAAALAISRAGPNDWRPELLIWYFSDADIDGRIESVLVRSVLLEGARAKLTPDANVIATAVGDALHIIRFRRSVPSLRRAAQLGVTRSDFLTLRRAAEAVLLRAIRTGLKRYVQACGYLVDAQKTVAPPDRQTLDYGSASRAA